MSAVAIFAITALMLAAGLACALATWRIVRGPKQADRVIALDIFLAAALTLCVTAGLATGRTVFVDVGIGLALVGFVGTVGWARLIQRSPPSEDGAPAPSEHEP